MKLKLEDTSPHGISLVSHMGFDADTAGSGDDIDNDDDDDKKICEDCEADPCVFVDHKESLLAFDEAEHSLQDDTPTVPNNVRRKLLYRQLTLMINGGPLGAGVRRPLPDCCVNAIRAMLPSDTFMGFKTE